MPAAGPPPIVAEELDLLERVGKALEAPGSAATATPSERALVQELERLREALRDGTKTEDRPALLEQWHRHSALLEQLRTSRAQPRVSPDSPYFGHLRLREENGDQDILLGKGTHLGSGVAIVDWRHAPVSRLFYRYRQGDRFDEEIAGRERSGEVLVRRTVTIRDRRLQRVDAPEGIFQRAPEATGGWRRIAPETARLAGGEGAALRAHAVGEGSTRRLGDPSAGPARADKHLPDIAGLIDPEQFALITRPTSGFVVIRGAAGSGKTTVALHRIAYLAYDDPKIDSDRTLVVVFSPALRDYVSHVLPALGVHQVLVRTFHEWAREIRRRVLPMLPADGREDTPAVVQRLKLHPAMLAALAAHIADTPGPATPAQVVDDWASVSTHAPRIHAALAASAPDAFGPEELRRALDWMRREHEKLAAWLGGDRTAEAELDAEDDALLLRAWQLRVGALPAKSGPLLRYRHVAVDEVQDFSPLEVQVLLGCLDQRKSITLAGDTQQHLLENTGFTSWATFFEQLGLKGAEVDTLEVSYRCSRQVASFAVGVLGPLREDDTPLRTVREGPSVELFRFADHGACVAFLAHALRELAERERNASVAVLTPSRELSALYAQGLVHSEVPRARQVVNQDFTFAPGVEVTEIEQVKGLEFDYVILVEASSTHFPDRPGARRLLHVGATRAVHQLWLTSVATPSPLVRAPLEETP
ncbi:MAG: AAA family ATPase [Deltaproteobacteria bacterium]|nr:AAA family ATPase [Deltaproteobacteria bacterium]